MIIATLDAIRNITGEGGSNGEGRDSANKGAIIKSGRKAKSWGGGASSGTYNCDFKLNANTDTASYGNPMAGHANGSDIHPYNINLIPLIAY